MPASLPRPVSRPANVLAGISAFSLALLCIAPFLWPYHRHPFTSFYSEWIALICGLGVCLVMLRRARRAYPVQPPEFDRELAALARRYPARMQPLLELPAPGATAPPP